MQLESRSVLTHYRRTLTETRNTVPVHFVLALGPLIFALPALTRWSIPRRSHTLSTVRLHRLTGTLCESPKCCAAAVSVCKQSETAHSLLSACTGSYCSTDK